MPTPDPVGVAIPAGARVGAMADQLIIAIVRDKIQITICLNGLVRTFLVWTNLVEDLILGEMNKILSNPVHSFLKQCFRMESTLVYTLSQYRDYHRLF